MKFYEFGNEQKPVVMLLPGTCCHWKNNFGHVIDMLRKDFFVICVSYDGFDETEETEFPDMITETEKIEKYITDRFGGIIHCAYGCSLGGSFVGLLTQRKNVHINHGILGSSDLDQSQGLSAKLQTAIIGLVFYPIIHKGKVPKFLVNRLEKKGGKEYAEKGLKLLGIGETDLSFVTKKSIKNQFYSDLTTEIENGIECEGTTIHCFYAAKMGEEYLKRYYKHFKNPDIIKHNLNHEELLVCKSEEWAGTIRKITL